MSRPFFVKSLDSDTPETGNPGDWLVETIREDGVHDRYLIEADKFEGLYELDPDYESGKAKETGE